MTIPYQNISLHAAQGPSARGEGEKGCIYMQLDGATHLLSEAPVNGEDGEEDEGITELVEVHITPADESTCPTPPFTVPFIYCKRFPVQVSSPLFRDFF